MSRILGTAGSVASMPGETLRDIHAERYTGANLIVAAVGNVDHEEFVDAVRRRFSEVAAGERTPQIAPPGEVVRGFDHVARDTQQTHLVFAVPTVPYRNPDRYPLLMLSQAFGGGMSSRLFQRVREELGLAYAIYSFHSFYAEAGVSGVYVGTRPPTAAMARDTVFAELERLACDGLEPVEFAQVKEQVRGQLVLALESTGAKLHRLAGYALRDEELRTVDEILEEIDAVTPERVANAAARYLAPDRHYLLSLGPNG